LFGIFKGSFKKENNELSELRVKEYRQQLVEFSKGGFAPNVILLREFHYEKAGEMLDGLHFFRLDIIRTYKRKT